MIPPAALADIAPGRARVWRGGDIARMERLALAQGLPLMERAGCAAASLVADLYPQARSAAVVAGPGNNGGDAWVCARHLRATGVEIACFAESEPQTDDARSAWRALQAQQPIPARPLRCAADLDQADVIIDGLLGTGVRGELRPGPARVVECINASATPVLALDLPSGLGSDAGAGRAVRAAHTLSFLALKHALFAPGVREYVGRVHYCDLGIADEIFDSIAPWYDLALARPSLCRRADSHKGDFGTVWLIGGQGSGAGATMAGAVVLAARAAARCGCGLVRVYTHGDHVGHLAAGFPDAIWLDAERDLDGNLDGAVAGARVVRVLGPGLGMSEWSRSVFARAIVLPGTAVIDADALNLLASQRPGKPRDASWILTPHPKEAARLLGVEVAQIQKDRFEAVRSLAREFDAIVVLKGCSSLISDGARTLLCPWGNPAMACAGMGDVLSGVIGALLAQGSEPMDAAAQGVALHAWSADRLLEKYGWGMTASDVAEALRVRAPGA